MSFCLMLFFCLVSDEEDDDDLDGGIGLDTVYTNLEVSKKTSSKIQFQFKKKNKELIFNFSIKE